MLSSENVAMLFVQDFLFRNFSISKTLFEQKYR